MLILDAYTGYRVQLVKEQEKTQFYFSFKIHLNLLLD